MGSVLSVRLTQEAESRLQQEIIKTGKAKNLLINEAVSGWFKTKKKESPDLAALIKKQRKKFADVPQFDEREFTKAGRK
jgi:hypothetical protein